jgi:hypothetical protein
VAPADRPGTYVGLRAVPLDPLQDRIARVALALPEARTLALAGGGAMIAHGFVTRQTAAGSRWASARFCIPTILRQTRCSLCGAVPAGATSSTWPPCWSGTSGSAPGVGRAQGQRIHRGHVRPGAARDRSAAAGRPGRGRHRPRHRRRPARDIRSVGSGAVRLSGPPAEGCASGGRPAGCRDSSVAVVRPVGLLRPRPRPGGRVGTAPVPGSGAGRVRELAEAGRVSLSRASRTTWFATWGE